MQGKYNNMKKLTILFLGLLIGTTGFAQQSTQYSQYMFNGLYINPAYSGYKEALNMNAYYRSQWTGMPDGPKTTALAVDDIMNNGKVGLGLNLIHDKLGNERNFSAYANYAYRIQMGWDPSKRLAFGLGFGLQNTGFNNGGVITVDDEVIDVSNTFLPDVRFGVYYSSYDFFAGFSADNLLSSAIFNDKNKGDIPPVRQFYLTAGGVIPISYDILFKPSTLIKSAEKGDSRALSTDLNAALIFAERFTVGVTYRTALLSKNTSMESRRLPKPNALIGLIEVVAASNLRLGYSFDHSLSGVQSQTGSTHEISVGYIFERQRKRVRTPRYF